jgi:hypothetical protein
MKKITLIAVLLTVTCAGIFAQTEQQKSNLYIDGQFAISTNAKALFINLGGPTIRFNFQNFQ